MKIKASQETINRLSTNHPIVKTAQNLGWNVQVDYRDVDRTSPQHPLGFTKDGVHVWTGINDNGIFYIAALLEDGRYKYHNKWEDNLPTLLSKDPQSLLNRDSTHLEFSFSIPSKVAL